MLHKNEFVNFCYKETCLLGGGFFISKGVEKRRKGGQKWRRQKWR
jgi:hypothetical protein